MIEVHVYVILVLSACHHGAMLDAGFMFEDPRSHYLGCFTDQLPASTMPVTSFPDRGFTTAQCQSYCMLQQFTFAALQNGGVCYCSDTYGQYGESTSCNKRCESEPDVTCGGVLASSVYTSCPEGHFGKNCVHECHCRGRRPCDIKTGRCPLGGCQPGWEGKRCHFRSRTTFTIDKLDKVSDPSVPESRSMLGHHQTSSRDDVNSNPENDVSFFPSAIANINLSSLLPSYVTISHRDIIYTDDDVRIGDYDAVTNHTHAQPLYVPFDTWQRLTRDLSTRARIIGISAGAVNLIGVVCLLIFTWSRRNRTDHDNATTYIQKSKVATSNGSPESQEPVVFTIKSSYI